MKKLINSYPDGTTYADISEIDLSDLKEITFRINSYEDLWHLGQIIDALNHNGIIPTVTIPNLIDAQADARFSSSQSSGLQLVANFLKQFKAHYKIFHPHNPMVVEALFSPTIITNESFINEVLNKICHSYYNDDCDKMTSNLVLMASDAGGFKPLVKLCDSINWKGEMYSASKARSWDETDGTKFVQQIDKQDFEGKDVLIIDDICVYGGTFKGLSKILSKRNVGKLFLAISHITVSDLGEDPITNYYNQVFSTNSKYQTYKTSNVFERQPNNLIIIKMF